MPSLFSVAVFNDMVYWSDTHRRSIQAANKLTGKNRKVLLKRPGQPFDLKVRIHAVHITKCHQSSSTSVYLALLSVSSLFFFLGCPPSFAAQCVWSMWESRVLSRVFASSWARSGLSLPGGASLSRRRIHLRHNCGFLLFFPYAAVSYHDYTGAPLQKNDWMAFRDAIVCCQDRLWSKTVGITLYSHYVFAGFKFNKSKFTLFTCMHILSLTVYNLSVQLCNIGWHCLVPPPPCIFCMSLLVNTPDSDNQLVRSELRAWMCPDWYDPYTSVHCSLLPERGKSVDVYFTSEHSFTFALRSIFTHRWNLLECDTNASVNKCNVNDLMTKNYFKKIMFATKWSNLYRFFIFKY